MVFVVEQTRQALQAFDMSQTVAKYGAVADYCRFYHLDFEQDFPNIKHSCGYFEVAGYSVVAHSYVAAQARGTVWVIHGYLEHSGLYRHIIPVLLAADYSVVIYDLPAHGLSSGTRASIASFAEYQQVLIHLIDYFNHQLPQPWLAIGQSTGAAILMDYVLSQYAQKKPVVFQRLLLLAPLVYPAKMQWLQLKLAFWWFKSVRSGLPRVFRQNTSDRDFVRFMRDEDPLQAHWIPVSWLLALKQWIEQIHKFPRCDCPVWVIQGGKDKTVNGDYNVAFIKNKFDVKSVLCLPEAGHQLVNESLKFRQPIEVLLRKFLMDVQMPDENVN
jgi:alpha-beta hydrolase superfamily lysophospholipase